MSGYKSVYDKSCGTSDCKPHSKGDSNAKEKDLCIAHQPKEGNERRKVYPCGKRFYVSKTSSKMHVNALRDERDSGKKQASEKNGSLIYKGTIQNFGGIQRAPKPGQSLLFL